MPKSRQILRRNVLVTIMNNPRDFEIARDSHWYRIPKDSVDKWLVKSWPPEWLAFLPNKGIREGIALSKLLREGLGH